MRARVAIVCVSMRPDFVGAVARNVIRQVDVDLEFVFVANSPGFDLMDLDAHFRAISRPTVVRADAGTSLGRALNLGMSTTDARFVAKFDDDDRYGPHHLVDSLRAHGFARSGVVGKHTYYAEIESTGERVIRFPANEFRYTSTLAGGTLVIDRERVGDLVFDDRSIGEDRAFIDACHRRGISTYSADRFNFLQRRGADNTWNVPAESFLIGCESISVDEPAHLVDR